MDLKISICRKGKVWIRKDYRGVKQMKSKDRVTLMVATSAVGGKIPLFMVGKAKAPECFRLCQGNKPPMAYHHQANAWFDNWLVYTTDPAEE